jgi:hypothetical protein
MSLSLTREERRFDRTILWSDVVLVGLAFVLAWLVTGIPEAVKAWPANAQFPYHALTCAAITAGVMTFSWWRPVGFAITFMAYGLIAASQVVKSGGVWLGLAGVAIIGGFLIVGASRRLRAIAAA